MQTSRIFFLAIAITILTLSYAIVEDNAEFLFENAKICGDPFSDPIWIPTLDLCTIQCDSNSEYCVENEDLQQQCKKMPDECQKLLQEKKRKRTLHSN
ncbi:unnamed protein product [Cylicocyclus nassatus]|uniref:Uncharacterized protein n=1 Tax=Cylicocyclus nassatus TaxID=53992 RepID=A0AA36GXN5_CYLNA|nr:unnamed protein product [Cylicocyclus nassatus]